MNPTDANALTTCGIIQAALEKLIEIAQATPTNESGDRVFHDNNQVMAAFAIPELLELKDTLELYDHCYAWKPKNDAKAAALMGV